MTRHPVLALTNRPRKRAGVSAPSPDHLQSGRGFLMSGAVMRLHPRDWWLFTAAVLTGSMLGILIQLLRS